MRDNLGRFSLIARSLRAGAALFPLEEGIDQEFLLITLGRR
jgi:hypothetical protein